MGGEARGAGGNLSPSGQGCLCLLCSLLFSESVAVPGIQQALTLPCWLNMTEPGHSCGGRREVLGQGNLTILSPGAVGIFFFPILTK